MSDETEEDPRRRDLSSAFPLDTLFAPLTGNADEPSKLGRFSILGKIGEGGMGTVYLGHDETLDRKAAVKILRASHAGHQARVRMLREAQALARVSHPNVVQVYESGEHGDEIYIAMEFVDGPTLREWMIQSPRTPAEICEVFIAAGRGLAAAHEKGLVHRDFKPDNVMIGKDGRVRVMDFGLVRAGEGDGDLASTVPDSGASRAGGPLTADLTETGTWLGTPAYMAPEQYSSGPIDVRTDQFSFCVAFWEALYGQRPFVGKTLAALAQNVLAGRVSQPPAGGSVRAAIAQVIARGLTVDPSGRWPTMEALLQALSQAEQKPRIRPIAVFGAIAALLAIAWMVVSFTDDSRGDAAVDSASDSAIDPGLDSVAADDLTAFVRNYDVGDYDAAIRQIERLEARAPDSAAVVFWRATLEHSLGNEAERWDRCEAAGYTPAGGGERWRGGQVWRELAVAACSPSFALPSELQALLEPDAPSRLPAAWLPFVVSESLIPRLAAARDPDSSLRREADHALRRLDEPHDFARGPALEIRWQLARFDLRLALGRFDEAGVILDELLTSHSEAPIVLARASHYYALAGELERATELAERVARHDPLPRMRLLLDAGRMRDAAALIDAHAERSSEYRHDEYPPELRPRLLEIWCAYAYRFELEIAPERCHAVEPGLRHNLWVGAREDSTDRNAMTELDRAVVDRQRAINQGECGLNGADASAVVPTIPPFETYLRQLDITSALCLTGLTGDSRSLELAEYLTDELLTIAPGDPWALLTAAQVDEARMSTAAALAKRRMVMERWRDADDDLPLVRSLRDRTEAAVETSDG